MFLENKYTKWYYSIVENARERNSLEVGELHHILPRCICQEYSDLNRFPENGVYLTYKEHFLVHWLLTKMVNDEYLIRKLNHAFGKFVQSSPNAQRILTARQYERSRQAIREARLGTRHTKEARMKMSNSRRGMKQSKESNKKRSLALKGKPKSEEHKRALRGKKNSEEHNRKISEANKGHRKGMTGKKHSKKTRKLMSIRQKETMTKERRKHLSKVRTGIVFTDEHMKNLIKANKRNGIKRKGVKQKQIKCLYCEKIGGKSGMKRYHFENCKFKEKQL